MKDKKELLTRCLPLLVMVTALFSSCSDEEAPTHSSIYWILNRVGMAGNISLYNDANKSFVESIFTMNSPASMRFESANRNGDYLYVTTAYDAHVLRKIEMNSRVEMFNAPTHLHTDHYNGEQFIEFDNSTVLVIATVFSLEREMSTLVIKMYNENLVAQDSLGFDNYFGPMAAKAVNGKLFMALRNSASEKLIVIFDLLTKQVVKTISTPAVGNGFVVLDDKNLFAFNSLSQLVIDVSSGDVKKTYTFPAMAHATAGPGNILYYLRAAAQPSMTPYYLMKADLTTSTSILLGDGNEIIHAPIVYNNRANLIVTGGGLKFLKPDGSVEATVQAPANATHIFIK